MSTQFWLKLNELELLTNFSFQQNGVACYALWKKLAYSTKSFLNKDILA